MKRLSQSQKILHHLKTYGKITSLEAMNHDNGIDCMRLSARIWDIQNKLKVPITGEMVYYTTAEGVHKHYKVYRLAEVEDGTNKV